MACRAATRDYLTELLTAYWFAPPVALWRAVELRVAAEERYERPLLDLGCGDGVIAQALFGTERYVDVGLDTWMAQLRHAARSDAYLHLHLADGHHLPCASGTFTTVFSNSVLEHIPVVEPVLREVARVLRRPDPTDGRPGGRLVLTTPSDAFRRFLDGYAQRMAAGDAVGAEAYATSVDARLAHHHYHTPEEWGDLLAAAGLAVVRARYYIPREVERFWDRMNARYGIAQQGTAWGLLVSRRLRSLGYQAILRRLVVRCLSHRWRRYYEMDVPAGEKGGGLLIVARRKG